MYVHIHIHTCKHMKRPCMIYRMGDLFQATPTLQCMYVCHYVHMYVVMYKCRKHRPYNMNYLIPFLPYLKPSVLFPISSGSNAQFQAGSFDFRRAHARRIVIHVFDMTKKVYDMDRVVCRQTDLRNLAPAKAGIRW